MYLVSESGILMSKHSTRLSLQELIPNVGPEPEKVKIRLPLSVNACESTKAFSPAKAE